jgi:RNA polymerase sigma-70 factor, ECF subfamily
MDSFMRNYPFSVLEVPIKEHDLIPKILSGDTAAYAEIVRTHQAKVLGLCASLLGNATQAEDAAQEVFIKAHQSLRSFRGDSAFSTWLYRITANHCKDLLRKRSRERTESLDAMMEETAEGIQKFFEPSSDPRGALGASDLIEKLLSSLSPEERLVLTLREVQGLSYREISKTLECTLDAVKARLKRARQTLEEKVRHFSGVGDV